MTIVGDALGGATKSGLAKLLKEVTDVMGESYPEVGSERRERLDELCEAKGAVLTALMATFVNVVYSAVEWFFDDIENGLGPLYALEAIRMRSEEQLMVALHNAGEHPEEARILSALLKTRAAWGESPLSEVIVAGEILGRLTETDPHLEIVRLGLESYWESRRGATAEMSGLEVAEELYQVLERLTRSVAR